MHSVQPILIIPTFPGIDTAIRYFGTPLQKQQKGTAGNVDEPSPVLSCYK